MRINKYLADCGIASRRKCEELILQGKVKVNGKLIKELGIDVKPTDIVSFENRVVKPVSNKVYYKLHKPKGYVTTVNDEKGRKTVLNLMRNVHERVYPIGRLDYDTEGLLIMTNDGDITNILTHPKSLVEKTYIATIDGPISAEDIKTLSSGVDIGGYITKPCKAILTFCFLAFGNFFLLITVVGNNIPRIGKHIAKHIQKIILTSHFRLPHNH